MAKSQAKAEFDFTDYITDRNRDFTGRKWVFTKVDKWLGTPNAPRYFIITGEPGIGKTAIAASLTHVRDLDAVHFCIARQADTVDPLNFARSLSHQLTHIDDFARYLLEEQGVHIDVNVNIRENYGQVIGVQIENLIIESPSAKGAFNRAVVDPLKRLYQSGFERQIVILVDALDEAVQHRGETIVVLLANVGGLPPQVRFLLTSRRDTEALRHFKEMKIPYLLLDAGGEENLQDVREYVSRQLRASQALRARVSEQKMKPEAFVDLVTTASHGNFLYLVWSLAAIAEGTQHFDSLEALPKGLDGVYSEFLRTRTVGKDIRLWQDYYRPLLGVLAVAKAPLMTEQLAHFAGLSHQRVHDLLLDVRQFLNPVQFERAQHQLFHQSLKDFLSAKDRAEEFWIDSVSIHTRISIYYLEHYTSRWSDCDLYGMRYLVIHLIEARLWQGLEQVLTDFKFIESKCAAGMTHDLITDYNKALDALPEARTERQQVIEHGETGKQYSVIEAFSRALGQEAHRLAKHPGLLWPQLNSRLQWEKEPVSSIVKREQKRRTQPESSPWLWVRTPFAESQALMRTLEGHEWGAVCAFSPDGSFIVSAGWDKSLKIWDAESGEEKMTLKGHTEVILACDVSPNGELLASSSSDHTIRLWEARTGHLVRKFEGHTDSVGDCVFSPNGKKILSAGHDKLIKIWDVSSGEELLTLSGHTLFVNGCAFSPDASLIASTSTDGTVKIWDAESGKNIKTLRGDSNQSVLDCAFSPDSSLLVIAGVYEKLIIWKTETWEQVRTLKGRGPYHACMFSPDGTLIAAACNDNTVRIWNAGTGEEKACFKGHTASVNGCAFSPDGTLIVSACQDGTLKLWRVEAEKKNKEERGHGGTVNALSCSPDGSLLASAGGSIIKLWDANTGKLLRIFEHNELIYTCAVSPDRKYIISANRYGRLMQWDIVTGKQVRTLKGHIRSVYAIAFSPEGMFIASAGDDLKFWDARTGKLITSLKGRFTDFIRCAISPAGTYFLTLGQYGDIQKWDLKTGKKLHKMKGHTLKINHLAISPDSTLILSASLDGSLALYDAETGRVTQRFESHKSPVRSCAFSPDGRLIVSAKLDGTVEIWEIYSGRAISAFIFPGILESVAFHVYRSVVFCGDTFGNVHFVDLKNIKLGALIVYASCSEEGFAIRCPVCGAVQKINQNDLGKETTCQNCDCTTALQICPNQIESSAWLLSGGKLPRESITLQAHKSKVSSLASSLDMSCFLSVSSDCLIKVWDIKTGKPICMFSQHKNPVVAATITDDSNQAVSISLGESVPDVYVWDLKTGAQRCRLQGSKPAKAAALSRDGKIALIAEKGRVAIWDLGKNEIKRAFLVDGRSLTCLSLDPSGHWAGFGTESGDFFVWDLEGETNKVEVLRTRCGDPIKAVTVMPWGWYSLYGTITGKIRIWETKERKQLESLSGHNAPVNALSYDLYQHTLASIDEDGILQLWDSRTEVRKWEHITTERIEDKCTSCVVAADSQTVIVGTESGRIHIICVGIYGINNLG